MIKTITNAVVGVTVGVLLGATLSSHLPLNIDSNPELFNIKGKYTVRCDNPDGTREVIDEVSVWEGSKGTLHYVNLDGRKPIELGNECILYNIGLF